jgi:hypothetical protein
MEKNMERQLKNSSDWRFEKKFVVESHLYASVLKTFLIDGWYEIFPDRYVNSIYFDDTKFTSYYENLLGISDRTKYRLRFYGKIFKGEGVFERKIRHSDVNTKKTIRVYDLNLNLLKLQFPKMNTLSPLVHVRYKRKYFFNSILDCRMTIDRNIEYKCLNSKNLNNDDKLVIEIKSNNDNSQQNLPEILSQNSRNSKYCSSVSSLNLVEEGY